jgi:DNA transformation protein
LAHALDLMQGLGAVQARRMFGGYGLFLEGLMFAVWLGEALYFKVDAETVGRYEALGLPPFRYQAKGREMALRYHLAPPEVHDDPGQMADWARQAHGCAVRAAAARRPSTRLKPDR